MCKIMIFTKEVFGKGAFGSVFKTNHPELVLKTFHHSTQLHREATLWTHLVNRCEHCTWPYAGQLIHGIVLRDSGETLYDYAKRRDVVRYHFLHIIKNIREQLYHMHVCAGIEHRDLSPFNVLCAVGQHASASETLEELYDDYGEDEDEEEELLACPPLVTLIDLTNASIPESYQITHRPPTCRANPCIKSPEEVLNMMTLGFASDAWALGVLIIWLATGCIFKPPRGSTPQAKAVAFVDHYGLPVEGTKERAEWDAAWQGAGFDAAAAAGNMHPIIRAVRAGEDVRADCELRCSSAQWRQVRGIVRELLSFTPSTRVGALHDQRRWDELTSYLDTNVFYELDELPPVKPLSVPLICDVCRPRGGTNEVLHVLRTEVVNMQVVHSDVMRMCSSVIRGALDADGAKWAKQPADHLSRRYNTHMRVLAIAALDVAVALCGSFGAATQDLLGTTKIPSSAMIHSVARFIWASGAAVRAVDELTVI